MADWLIALPDPVRQALDGYTTTGDDLRTASDSAVYRYRRGGDCLILKCTRSRSDAPLSREAAAMRWLDGKLDVPRVICCHDQDEAQYLVVTCLPGISGESKELQGEVSTLVRLFADGLEQIRAVPIAGCPFDHTPEAMVAHAWSRIAEGRVHQSWVEETGMGSDATAVLKELERSKPDIDQTVFSHGDYCLPNIMVSGGRIAGFVDLGHAGIGDTHRDFVAARYTIKRNLGRDWIAPFFDLLGVSPDQEKMQWYSLMQSFE